jgi:S-adenosylmethionine-diacylglycerol 3-amino-3-carboxypropyl transferase
MSVVDWLGGQFFRFVHGTNLVYNTCWEDPRLDRAALELGEDDTVLVITSAGCNALDYALTGPRHVFAVDLNPRQNALLELKMAGIRALEFETFFSMFGRGQLRGAGRIYRQALRPLLSARSQRYWDRRISFFEEDSARPSFYFCGTSGTFARAFNFYIDHVARLRPWLDAVLSASCVAEQQRIYERHLHDRFWSPGVRFALRRDAILSLLGVPPAQRAQVARSYRGGLVEFVEACLEAVFARLPLADNYFWRVYLTGRYTPQCCPEYLKHDNFQKLKNDLVHRITVHTNSVQGFLDRHAAAISRFVLLDHMDWFCGERSALLEQEWQAIVRRAAPHARVIWRSGGLLTEFVDRAQVMIDGRRRNVGELLTYHPELAQSLHEKCRVHTYGSFHIADLAV